MWLSQRRRLLVLGPQTGRHSWEALSTGLTGSEKLLVLGVKVGRHAGGTGDSYRGLHFCVFFLPDGLRCSCSCGSAGKALAMHAYLNPGSQQPDRKAWPVFPRPACPPRAERQRQKDLSGTP